MRILYSALKYDYGMPARGESLERAFFLPALENVSEEVIPFWLEEHGFPSDLDGLQAALIKEVDKVKPDIVFFILMRDEIRIETIRALSAKCITVNWFADDQWRFEHFTRYVAPALTYSITVDKYCLGKYSAIGCTKVILSQWGCPYSECNDEDENEYDWDVSFVGGRTSVREWYVRVLERAGVHVECFGEGWPRGRVSFDDMRRVFRRSRICLNLSNSQPKDHAFRAYAWKKLASAVLGCGHGGDGYRRSLRTSLSGVHSLFCSLKRSESIKARNFEIPAWGGFQISHFALEIEDYFIPGKEIVLFSTTDELVRVVDYYLENNDEREKIRRAGMARAAEHDYEVRMRKVLERIGNDSGNILRA